VSGREKRSYPHYGIRENQGKRGACSRKKKRRGGEREIKPRRFKEDVKKLGIQSIRKKKGSEGQKDSSNAVMPKSSARAEKTGLQAIGKMDSGEIKCQQKKGNNGVTGGTKKGRGQDKKAKKRGEIRQSTWRGDHRIAHQKNTNPRATEQSGGNSTTGGVDFMKDGGNIGKLEVKMHKLRKVDRVKK